MKKILVIVSLLTTVFTCRAGSVVEQLWDEANTAYVNGNYERAIEGYDSIMAAGYESYKLYYNLGNSWFKKGQIGKSILYYNKALKLAPGDADVKHNLSVANTYVKDKIESVPTFFLKTWTDSIRMSMSSNMWAVLSLVFLATALAFALLYFLSSRLVLRKTGFYVSALALVFFITSVSFSLARKKELYGHNEAVVMSTSAPVKSSPDNKSTDIFILHEGTVLTIISTLDEWVEVRVADGNKGWMPANSVELIN